MVNVLEAVSGADCSVPLVAFAPDHAPLAVQEVALVEDHVSVVVAPATIVVGAAVIVTVGAR